MRFREYLDLDPEEEARARDALNMTASLPGPAGPVDISGLTRGFHLNTIVGRMILPWTNVLSGGGARNWRRGLADIFKDGEGGPNARFMAAYDLFKDEISKAVRSLPFKTGTDVRTGREVDALGPVKGFMRKYESEAGDYLDHLDSALDLSLKVFPLYHTQVSNFINFLEITRDEFMTFGERLPRLGEEGLERDKKEESRLNRKIREYEAMRKRIAASL